MRPTLDILPTAPPNAPDLEQALLGAMMLQHDVISGCLDIVPPGHYYLIAHQRIAGAIAELFEAGRSVDIMTVTQKLASKGQLEDVGGAYYLSQLTNKVASGKHVEEHALLVQQMYLLRRLQDMSSFANTINDQSDPHEVMAAMQGQLAELQALVSSQAPARSMAEIVDKIHTNRERPVLRLLGLNDDMDECIRLAAGDVMTIGARPAVGKTATALAIARNIANQGGKAAIISLEMSDRQLAARSIATETMMDSNKITRAELEDYERERIAIMAAQKGDWMGRVFIDDRATLAYTQVMGLFGRLKAKQDVDTVILDYLQLVQGANTRNPVDDMSVKCNALKAAAKYHGIRLIQLSQMTREAEKEDRPQKHHLYGAGQIEAASDIIILLQRSLNESHLTMYLDKHKFGPVGHWRIPYNLSTQEVGASAITADWSPRLPDVPAQSTQTDDDNPF